MNEKNKITMLARIAHKYGAHVALAELDAELDAELEAERERRARIHAVQAQCRLDYVELCGGGDGYNNTFDCDN